MIPAQTQFLLTTNTALVQATSKSSPIPGELGFNPHANERYFDRPEVLKAYKEQQTIQTPEFINLVHDASVGGRFRPRGLEDVRLCCFPFILSYTHFRDAISFYFMYCYHHSPSNRRPQTHPILLTKNGIASTKLSRNDNGCAKRKNSNMSITS